MLFQVKKVRLSNHASLKKQQGMVIVVALFIVALVAAMAYSMVARLERDTRRTTLILRDTQAEFYAQGSLAWAMDTLRNNWEKKKLNQIVDTIPQQSPVNTVKGYAITSTIYDMQSRFNLNNLTNATAQIDFKKLIQVTAPTVPDEKVLEVMMAVIDWISSAKKSAYDEYYANLPLPYRAAHRPMTSVSELRLVMGMTPQLYAALEPYVTALPTGTVINVQTAAAPVLATLSASMTLDAGKNIEKVRVQKPFILPSDFFDLAIVKNHEPDAMKDKITTTSAYFLVVTTVTIESQKIVLYTLLERAENAKKNKVAINILWQSKVSGA